MAVPPTRNKYDFGQAMGRPYFGVISGPVRDPAPTGTQSTVTGTAPTPTGTPLPVRPASALDEEDRLRERQMLAQTLREEAQGFMKGGMSREDTLKAALKSARDLQMGVAAGVNEDQMRQFLTNELTPPTETRMSFADQEAAARERASKEGAFGNAPVMKSSTMQAPTPRLDRLAAMQGQPLGATSPLRRNEASPTGGTPIGSQQKSTRADILQRIQYLEMQDDAREQAIRNARQQAYTNRPKFNFPQ